MQVLRMAIRTIAASIIVNSILLLLFISDSFYLNNVISPFLVVRSPFTEIQPVMYNDIHPVAVSFRLPCHPILQLHQRPW
jgi:hypothetical protein